MKVHWREARTTAFNRRKVILGLLAAALSLLLIVSPLFHSTTEASSWVLQSSGTSSTLYGIWGDSSSNVYACGDNGTILHFDGSQWSTLPSDDSKVLYGIWGHSPVDAFAVGNVGTILRYDGSDWKSMESGTMSHLNGIWGASSGEVFAVGTRGTILQYEDGLWTSLSSGVGVTVTLYGIWGSSAGDVFAVGNGGTILHYDGLAWSTMTSNTTLNLWGVWGSSANDVFAVGNNGCVLHYDGHGWTQMTSGVGENLYSVWGISSSEVLAAGANGTILRYDGNTWTQMTTTTSCSLRGIRGSSATDVFAVGDSGTILRYSEFVPVVTSVSPGQVDQGDTLTLTIAGNNFTETTGITFGDGVFVEDFSIDSSTQISANVTVATEAVTGPRDVAVTNSHGTGILARGITIPHAQLSAVAPGSGYPGQTLSVSISGTNLGGAIAVDFGSGIAVTDFIIHSPSQINANISIDASASARTRDVTVTTPGSVTSLLEVFTVSSDNSPPIAADDYYEINEDETLNVTAPGVLGNDSDADGDAMTSCLLEGPGHGTLNLNSDGSFTYVPHSDFHGTDFFTYLAYDGHDYSNIATVTITVIPVNHAPVANDDAYTVDEDGILTVPEPGVLDNDSDADGDVLTAVIVSAPSFGSLTLNANGSFTYVPKAGFHGTDVFTYQATDGIAYSNPATVTITINPRNNAPVAADDIYATIRDSELSVDSPGVLGNDRGIDGDTLTAVLVSNVSYGKLELNGDGSFTYVPHPNFVGIDSFTYRVFDGSLYSEVATVVIHVDQARPIIVSADPNQGTPGQGLTIAVRGTNFTGATALSLGPGITVAGFWVESDEILTVEIVIGKTSAIGARDITVTTPAGTATLALGFTVIAAPPAVSSVYPTSAARGETLDVLVNGSNLTGITAISFGQGVTINSFGSDGPSRIVVNITVDAEAVAGSRVLYITAAGGTATLDEGFKVTIPPPIVTRVLYAPVQRGQAVEVEIHGANLDGATEINLGDAVTVSTFYLDGSTRIIATVNIADDASEGPRNVTVTTPHGTVTLPGGFNVEWSTKPSSLWLWLGAGMILAMLSFFFLVTRTRPVKKRSLLDP